MQVQQVQVDKEKEAKEKTKRLVITLVAVGILIFGCIGGCLVFGAFAPDVEPTAAPLPTKTREGVLAPGTYIVGKDVRSGTYQGGAGDDVLESCYWARLSDLSGELGAIIANDNAQGQFYVEVQSTDYALETACTLERVGD